MPSAAELARAEAERAEERDDDDDEHDADDEHDDDDEHAEPQPHPGEGLEEPTDTMLAELRAACDEHHDHVHAIMGPFVEGFVPCVDCSGIGIAYPKPQGRHLESAPQTVVCSVCKGEGELATGSKREGFAVVQCSNCNGHGWVGPGNLPNVAAAPLPLAPPPASTEAAPLPAPTVPGQSTDPRVLALQAEGFIVLPKPS